MHFAFPISSSDLSAVTGSATAVLTNATLLRIANSPAIGNAAQQVGVLGVDNITAAAGAAAVPEPGTVLLALTGAAFLVLLRRR
jgi:hypothetical protein